MVRGANRIGAIEGSGAGRSAPRRCGLGPGLAGAVCGGTDVRRDRVRQRRRQATLTGILPMRACHSLGPVWCTDVPLESTATVTGMSLTSNS